MSGGKSKSSRDDARIALENVTLATPDWARIAAAARLIRGEPTARRSCLPVRLAQARPR